MFMSHIMAVFVLAKRTLSAAHEQACTPEMAHLAVIVGCDQIHKGASPLVAVDDIAPVSVLLHPIQHRMAELLIGVGLHDLGHKVVRLQALKVQVLLRVDLLGLLADGELLTDPQKGHLHDAQSSVSASPSLPGKAVGRQVNILGKLTGMTTLLSISNNLRLFWTPSG